MRLNILLIIIMTFPLIVNAQNEEYYFPFKSKYEKEEYTLRSVAIDRANFLPEYYTHVVNYELENKMYLVCYSQPRTTLDFIDMKLMEYVGSLNLRELEGFDFESPILSYNIHENQLILFQSETLSQVHLTGFTGVIVKTAKINNDKGIFKAHTFHSELGFKPILNAEGAVYLMSLKYDVQLVDPAFYTGNNEVKINFNENKVEFEFLPVTYPKDYLKGYYGYYYMPRRVVNNAGKHIYSYSVSPTMHIWDPKSEKVSTVTAKSIFQEEEIAYLDPAIRYSTKELMTYTVETGTYTSLIYDPYRNIYYRFFRPSIAEGVDCNQCNYQDKPLSIMILDENFEIIDELYIGTTIYEEQTAFVGEDGLYLSCANTKNQNFGNGYISYDILGMRNPNPDKKDISSQLILSGVNENSYMISGTWNNTQDAVMTVFNLSGQVVYRDIYFSGKIVSLPEIAKGIYMVQIADTQNRVVLTWSN